MARSQFRSGNYKVVTSTAEEVPIRIDNDVFAVPPSSELEFNSNYAWSYDSTTYTGLKVYRIPSSPVTVTQSIGGSANLNPSGSEFFSVPNIKNSKVRLR